MTAVACVEDLQIYMNVLDVVTDVARLSNAYEDSPPK